MNSVSSSFLAHRYEVKMGPYARRTDSFFTQVLVFVSFYQFLPVITGDGLERLDFHNF